MDKIYIVCVDDQREVLSTLSKELQLFEKKIYVEDCESANEALELINEIDEAGDHVCLIISDHIMPGKNGVEFLTEIHNDGRFHRTKKMLLTGQATHQDTITAINQAQIEKYLEKPWSSNDLVSAVKVLLTQYIFDAGLEYEEYMSLLDTVTLYQNISKNS